jgi:hypothetical protein
MKQGAAKVGIKSFLLKRQGALVLLLLLLLMMAMIACEPSTPECYEPNSVRLNAGFIVRRDTIVVVDSISFRDSTIIQYSDSFMRSPLMLSLDTDSIYGVIGTPNGTSTLGIALNPNTDSMRYLVQFDTALAHFDTITFFYKPSIHFISNNCGYTHYFNIDSVHVTKNYLDSAAIQRSQVTNEANIRHVLFYFF